MRNGMIYRLQLQTTGLTASGQARSAGGEEENKSKIKAARCATPIKECSERQSKVATREIWDTVGGRKREKKGGGMAMPKYHLFLKPLVLPRLFRVERKIASGETLLLAPPLELRNVVHGHARLEMLTVVETRLEASMAISEGKGRA